MRTSRRPRRTSPCSLSAARDDPRCAGVACARSAGPTMWAIGLTPLLEAGALSRCRPTVTSSVEDPIADEGGMIVADRS